MSKSIKLTKPQYKTLLEVVYAGNWLINAIRSGDEKIKKYEEIEQHVFSLAKDFGMEELVEWSDEFHQFFSTSQLEETLEPYIEEYDDENFWEELVYKLAFRDFEEEYGLEAIAKMSWEERLHKQQPFLDKWWDEVEQNGIVNLGLRNNHTS